jgi:hypothetical protein
MSAASQVGSRLSLQTSASLCQPILDRDMVRDPVPVPTHVLTSDGALAVNTGAEVGWVAAGKCGTGCMYNPPEGGCQASLCLTFPGGG